MNLLRRLWRWIKARIHDFRAFLAWLREVVQRFFGAPYDALRRVLNRIIAAIRRWVESVLAGWERIWARNPEQRTRRRTHHLRASAALSTIVAAVVCYCTPLPAKAHLDGRVTFNVFVGIVWLVGFVVFAQWSRTDLEKWWVHWLWRLRQRTGLVTVERVGILAALALAVITPITRPDARLTPLCALIALNFFAFLADAYVKRVPSGAVAAVTTTTTEPGPGDAASRKRYDWTLEAGDLHEPCTLDLPLDANRVAEFRTRAHQSEGSRDPQFDDWVLHGSTPEVDVIARTFSRWCFERGWSQYVEVCLALSFAQHFRYTSDVESTGLPEYWRYPLETLADGEGDCEDMSILAAAILRRMGHTVALFVTDDHAALAVSAPIGVLSGHYLEHEGRRYYYCETTEKGWRVGEVPPAVDIASLRLSLLTPDTEEVAA